MGGVPKYLLPVKGKPMIFLVIEASLEAFCGRVAIITGCFGQETRDALSFWKKENPSWARRLFLLDNPLWQEGMGTSLARAAMWAQQNQSRALAVLLADQPLVEKEHLLELARVFNGMRPVAFSWAGKPVVPALFPPALFPRLAALEGEEGGRKILQDACATLIGAPERLLANANTPEAYAQILGLLEAAYSPTQKLHEAP